MVACSDQMRLFIMLYDEEERIMHAKSKLLTESKIAVPNVAELGRLYQRASAAGHMSTALAAEQAVLAVGRSEAALAEARNLAAFLDEV